MSPASGATFPFCTLPRTAHSTSFKRFKIHRSWSYHISYIYRTFGLMFPYLRWHLRHLELHSCHGCTFQLLGAFSLQLSINWITSMSEWLKIHEIIPFSNWTKYISLRKGPEGCQVHCIWSPRNQYVLCTVNPYTIALKGSLVHLHATDQTDSTELEYSMGCCSGLKVARSDIYYQICLSFFVRGFSFILDSLCQLPRLKFSVLYLASNYFKSFKPEWFHFQKCVFK